MHLLQTETTGRWRHILQISGLLVSISFAQMKFTTLIDRSVGPGVRHRCVIEKTQPWQINILEIDLHNPHIALASVKARDLLVGREETSAMARRCSAPGHRVVGAINADFFEANGMPVNLQIRNGEMLRNPILRTVVGFTAETKPVMGRFQFDGVLCTKNGQTEIRAINAQRNANQLVLYNQYFGSSTLTNRFGVEALLTPLQPWQVNDTLLCHIDSVAVAVGNMDLLPGRAVLSGHGVAGDFLKIACTRGDTVKIHLGLPPGRDKILEMVGGLPQIVFNGRADAARGQREEGGSSDFTNSRHPRTAVGVNQDSSKFFFVVVDGRQPQLSAGMSLQELADYLVSIGVHHGVNLDGGGSSTMVVDETIVNSPSDPAGERAVANGLLLLCTAAYGPVASLQVSPAHARVLAGQTLQLQVTGRDSFYAAVEKDPGHFFYLADSSLGKVNEKGLFVAANQDADGFIRISYGAVRDSIGVQVRTVKSITISPHAPATDATHTVQFSVRVIDSDEVAMAPAVRWQCPDTSVGAIDSTGLFRPHGNGLARIVVTLAGMSDTAFVTVLTGQGINRIDPVESLDEWSLECLNCDTTQTHLALVDDPVSFGRSALRIDYSFFPNQIANFWLYLKRKIILPGLPDSIMMDIRPDSMQYGLIYYATDEDGDMFKLVPRKRPNFAHAYQSIGAAVTTAQPEVSGQWIQYPLEFAYLAIKLIGSFKTGVVYRGAIYVDNLAITYPIKTGLALAGQQQRVNDFRLEQNYPNPFNDQTTIRFHNDRQQPLRLALYDVLGREAAVLFRGMMQKGEHQIVLNAESLAGGVYWLRCEPSGETKKLVLIK